MMRIASLAVLLAVTVPASAELRITQDHGGYVDQYKAKYARIRDKGERIGRNPKTGIEVPIDPRRVMVFKPSNVLKARINGEAVEAED